VAQPTLHLRRLEEIVGKPLVSRSPRGVTDNARPRIAQFLYRNPEHTFPDRSFVSRRAYIERRPSFRRYVMADIEAIKTATIHCMGFAFLSHWSVKKELALSQLRRVPISGLVVRRGFYWVLSGALVDPGDTFVRFCNDHRPVLT
jgi:DNA-binding transcriptional LysR family regulator